MSVVCPNCGHRFEPAGVPPLDNGVREVFDHYRAKILANGRLTIRTRDKIRSRLLEYTPSELKRAIDNFADDEWLMTHNAHRGGAFFFHSEDRIASYLNLDIQKNNQGNIDRFNQLKNRSEIVRPIKENPHGNN